MNVGYSKQWTQLTTVGALQRGRAVALPLAQVATRKGMPYTAEDVEYAICNAAKLRRLIWPLD